MESPSVPIARVTGVFLRGCSIEANPYYDRHLPWAMQLQMTFGSTHIDLRELAGDPGIPLLNLAIVNYNCGGKVHAKQPIRDRVPMAVNPNIAIQKWLDTDVLLSVDAVVGVECELGPSDNLDKMDAATFSEVFAASAAYSFWRQYLLSTFASLDFPAPPVPQYHKFRRESQKNPRP